eukprot:TRINITY_DN64416_c0_g1_i1.p1 TRINITY_DN64416_c0_g1~~TRINITY_DN64416_c0_g1_i1.p1  ORF type:complete len:596 (-),score=99.66 TRINITY_DN64416_c0_g1_i1:193-1980(-)
MVRQRPRQRSVKRSAADRSEDLEGLVAAADTWPPEHPRETSMRKRATRDGSKSRDCPDDTASVPDGCDVPGLSSSPHAVTSTEEIGASAEIPASGRRVSLRQHSKEKGRQIVPVNDFPEATQAEGRPCRRRFPVQRNWCNERLIYRNDPLGLRVVGVEVSSIASAASASAASASAASASASASAEQAAGARGTKRQISSSRSRKQPATQSTRGLLQARRGCERAVASPARASIKRSLSMEISEESNCGSVTAPGPSKLAKPGGSGNGKDRRVSFTEDAPRSVEINNFSDCKELWYSSCPVDCNRCDRRLAWGSEGFYPRSDKCPRFVQWKILCDTCAAESLFEEIGIWFVAGLAAQPQDEHIARTQIQKRCTSLMKLGKHMKSEKFVEVLGPEADDITVRNEVLVLALERVRSIFSSEVLNVEGDSTDDWSQGDPASGDASARHAQDADPTPSSSGTQAVSETAATEHSAEARQMAAVKAIFAKYDALQAGGVASDAEAVEAALATFAAASREEPDEGSAAASGAVSIATGSSEVAGEAGDAAADATHASGADGGESRSAAAATNDDVEIISEAAASSTGGGCGWLGSWPAFGRP